MEAPPKGKNGRDEAEVMPGHTRMMVKRIVGVLRGWDEGLSLFAILGAWQVTNIYRMGLSLCSTSIREF